MARYHIHVYLCLGLYIIYLSSGDTQLYYHLVSERPVCNVKQKQNHSVDLVCQYFERPDVNHGCVVTGMVWNKLGLHSITRIDDSRKYGIWEAIPGKGLADNEHVSLLRIRNFDIEDIGRYQCEILCQKEVAPPQHIHRFADVCLQQENENYAICGTQKSECSSSFWNGVCDPACDNQENLYDGFDCAPKVKSCSQMLEEYCQKAFANQICNKDCDNMECGWDGGDCISKDKRNNYANDAVVLVVKPNFYPGESGFDLGYLGKKLSQLFGSETIINVTPGDWLSKGSRKSISGLGHMAKRDINFSKSQLYLRIDNTKCQSRCFTNATYAARFLETAIDNGWDPGIPLIKVGVVGEVASSCLLENNTLLGIHSSTDEHIRSAHPAGHLPKPHKLGVSLPWLVIVLVVSFGTILFSLSLITYGIFRYRKRRAKYHNYVVVAKTEISRIKAAKDAPMGTDV